MSNLPPPESIKLRDRKDWYFTTATIRVPTHEEKFPMGATSRFIKFITFAEEKGDAWEKARIYAMDRIEKGKESVDSIELYKNNYIRDAEALVLQYSYTF